MVSFFGIKLGGKKSHRKETPDQSRSSTWNKSDPAALANEHPGFNFSRPQRPLSRPGTSYSIQGPSTFRAPFASNPEASSSMVELAPPSTRRLSIGSLRAVSSNPSLNLKGGRPKISGPIGPPVSLPISDGSRPGTAGSPGTSGSLKKDWINPLDVHFAKDTNPFATGSSNNKSSSHKSAMPPHSYFDVGPGDNDDDRTRDAPFDGTNGYPSPPPSLKSTDLGETKNQAQPPRTAAPSNLRRVNTTEEQTRLPSPAGSEDRAEGLAIRGNNVNSKRETMNFHGPKRTDDTAARKQWKDKSEQEKMEIKRRRQTEGFEGNFAAFNFGNIDLSMPMPSVSPDLALQQRAQSPAGSKDTTFTLEKRSTGESTLSESATSHDTWPEPPTQKHLAKKPAGKPLNPWTDELPQIPTKGHSRQMPSEISTFTAPSMEAIHARRDSDTRAPGTPTALRVVPPVTEQAGATNSKTDVFDAPPRLNPDSRPQSPLRSQGPMEGNFPLSKGLPRGRRPAPNPIVVPSPTRPAREDEGSGSLPSWADRTERHMSAMPAPLTPLGTSTFMDDDFKPLTTTTTGTTTTSTSSPFAPRLPSPTFSTLRSPISPGSEHFGSSDLELSFEEEIANSLGHHMLSDLGSPTTSESSWRVDKLTAPPRPPPITLPPAKNRPGGTPTGSIKSPVRTEFSSGFI